MVEEWGEDVEAFLGSEAEPFDPMAWRAIAAELQPQTDPALVPAWAAALRRAPTTVAVETPTEAEQLAQMALARLAEAGGAEEAVAIVMHLVHRLGGTVHLAEGAPAGALPLDLAQGAAAPLVAVPANDVARALLETHLAAIAEPLRAAVHRNEGPS